MPFLRVFEPAAAGEDMHSLRKASVKQERNGAQQSDQSWLPGPAVGRVKSCAGW